MINNRNQCPDGYMMSDNGVCQEISLPTIPNENPPGTREHTNCNDCIDHCIGNFMDCV